MARRILAALLLFAASWCTAQAACRAPRGASATLFGGVDDPDVLVWDSRDRLMQYSAGTSDARMFLLPHAMLNRPGTRAVVQVCFPQLVHSKFRMSADDAVGILIRTGRYRGRYGWVSSDDLHGPQIRESSSPW